MAPALITLVGRENHERAVIERSPNRAVERRPTGDEALATTNDYRLFRPPEASGGAEIFRTTCGRFDTLQRRLGGGSVRAWEDEELLETLTDPRVIQTITAQHVVARPRDGTLRLWIPTRLLD